MKGHFLKKEDVTSKSVAGVQCTDFCKDKRYFICCLKTQFTFFPNNP